LWVFAGADATEIAGQTTYDAALMKLDPSGTILWQKHSDGGGRCNTNACYGRNEARAVRPTAEDGYVFAGYAQFQLVNPPVPNTLHGW
jgi:hypothetical protein